MLKRRDKRPPAGSFPDGAKRTCVATGQMWSVSLKMAMLPDDDAVSLGGVDVEEEDADETGGPMTAKAPQRWAYADAGKSSPHMTDAKNAL